MKIVTDKQMKEILARLDSIDSNLNEFKQSTEIKLIKLDSMGTVCRIQFKCVSLIVSFSMAVILLGGGTYLVNMNDRLTNDYKSLQEKVETIK